MKTIIEVENLNKGTNVGIIVKKDNHSVYHVYCDGVLRHTPCSAEDVMRVLGDYLQSAHHNHSTS